MVLFDVNVLHAAAVMKLVLKLLKVWLENMKRMVHAEQLEDLDWNKMFEVYVAILKVYKLTQNVFGPVVS